MTSHLGGKLQEAYQSLEIFLRDQSTLYTATQKVQRREAVHTKKVRQAKVPPILTLQSVCLPF